MRILNAKELGLYVRQARIDRGLTQRALAAKCGTTQAWVSEFESGKPRAEIALVFRVLKALDIGVELNDRLRAKPAAPDDGVDINALAEPPSPEYRR